MHCLAREVCFDGKEDWCSGQQATVRMLMRKESCTGDQLIFAVKQIRFADRVISTSETGEVREIDASSTVPQEIPNDQHVDGFIASNNQVSSTSSGIRSSMELLTAQILPDKAVSRELSTYKYYISMAGTWKMLLFLLLSSSFAFGMVFSR